MLTNTRMLMRWLLSLNGGGEQMRYSDIERRLQRLAAQRSEDGGGAAYELWVDDGDGWLRGPNGEHALAAEFDTLFPKVIDVGGEPDA
jgi:hypothetical protein